MRHANILDNSPGMAMIWSSERLTMGDVCVNAKLIRSPTLLIGTFVRSPKAAKNKSRVTFSSGFLRLVPRE